ncbi:MAG: hypothetical protein U9N51_11210 [Bacteroidota bacterium]|nr:hypothetical protein [Bacteroidota bacterium]
MDTDDLSDETYNAIIIEAEKFNHNLTLQFGVMASFCENEEEYLKNAKELINEIKEIDKYDLEDIFFDNIPNIAQLHKCLRQMKLNIAEVEKIPKEKRHYEF